LRVVTDLLAKRSGAPTWPMPRLLPEAGEALFDWALRARPHGRRAPGPLLERRIQAIVQQLWVRTSPWVRVANGSRSVR
jgi:hypothetical protein